MTDQLKTKIDKIQKLLALTKNNPQEGEVQAAFLKAQRLMVQWGIEASQVEIADTPIKEVDKVTVSNDNGFTVWKRKLANIICENFRCEKYLHRSSTKYAEFVFIGLKEDVQIAVEVYKSAVNAIEYGANRAYRSFRNSGKQSAGIKGDYIIGFLLGLEEKFNEQRQAIEQEWGLILVKDAAVVEAKTAVGAKPVNLSNNLYRQGNDIAKQMGYRDGKSFNGTAKKLSANG